LPSPYEQEVTFPPGTGDFSPKQFFGLLCAQIGRGEAAFVPMKFKEGYGYEIVSQGEAQRKKYTVMYPIQDLLGPNDVMNGPQGLHQSITQSIEIGSWGGFRIDKRSKSDFLANPPDPSVPDAQDTMNSISYSPALRALQVTAPWSVLEAVDVHLEEFRLAKLRSGGADLPLLPKPAPDPDLKDPAKIKGKIKAKRPDPNDAGAAAALPRLQLLRPHPGARKNSG
jgi:hypothetical protein